MVNGVVSKMRQSRQMMQKLSSAVQAWINPTFPLLPGDLYRVSKRIPYLHVPSVFFLPMPMQKRRLGKRFITGTALKERTRDALFTSHNPKKHILF